MRNWVGGVCGCVVVLQKKEWNIGKILTRDPLALPRGKTCDASWLDFLFDNDNDDEDDDDDTDKDKHDDYDDY